MNFLRLFSNAKAQRSPRKSAPSRRSRPMVEMLEDRSLPSCNMISGHVFYDANNNGLMDTGELPLANTPVELRNAQNVVVGTATTDANGFYQFDHDATISQSVTTLTKTVNFPATQTNYALNGLVGQFDPELGTLVGVDITNAGSITSNIRVENTSTSSASTINATVGGKLTLTGPGNLTIQTNLSQNAGSHNASTYDGTIDFAGASGKDFGNKTANGTQTLTLTGNDMAAFIGTGNVTLTETAEATSTANGGGNLLVGVTSTASAQVTVVYRYIPSNCLKPGNYTIIKTADAPGYSDGKESRNGTVLTNPPGTSVIPVTLVSTDLPNNDFGELKPASLSGYVYADISIGGFNDGIKQSGEQGIAGVTVTLDGTDGTGTVHLTTVTDSNGLYKFGNLRPGSYALTQTQPAGYTDGKDTIGTPGGSSGNDHFTNINLPAGFDGVNNNFGEIRFAKLSGTVFNDSGSLGKGSGVYNNGVQDLGEAGIAGVTIKLGGVDYAGSSVSQSTTTDAAGHYSFANLAPGTYTLTETQPALLDGKDSLGSLGGQQSNDQFTGIAVAPGAAGINYNFGELIPSTIEGCVYGDIGSKGYSDGYKQPDEQGIASVSVTLTGSTDQGTVTLQQATDASGRYSFTGLRPGTYTITETQPSGWIDGKDTIGAVPGNTGNDVFSGINLGAGVYDPNNNFGELKPVILVSHDPILPKDVVPAPPVFTTPTVSSIISKGQLLASKLNSGDPMVSAEGRFINSLYTSILGRTAEEGGIAGWLAYLHSGGTRAGLVNAIWNSDEHRWHEITNIYQSILGINPDQGALNAYAAMFRNGASEFDVAAAIAAGPQAQALYPSQSDLVSKLYDYALGRSASPNELAAWQSFPGDRAALARVILTSDEALSAVVQRTFLQLLNRAPGAAEVGGRIAQLRGSSAGYAAMIVDIFTSYEFSLR